MGHDRMPPLADGQLSAEQREAVAAFTAARGVELSGPFIPLLRSPEVLNRSRALGDYVRFRSSLPPRLSEFVILLVARHWHQLFEWDSHCPLATAAGLPADTVQAIAEARRPAGMADDESRLHDFVTELQQTHGVSDPTYARVVEMFGERGVIDVIGIVGYYSLLAMVLNTAQTPRMHPGASPFASAVAEA